MNSNMSLGEGVQDGENDNSICENSETQQQNRKHHHRHTLHQLQRLEEIFWDNRHPDKKQRDDLSEELGMEPLQIKFWFQNKRTQMKVKHKHQENAFLRVENEKLLEENLTLRESLINACCLGCGHKMGDLSYHQRQLRMENARLREQIGRVSIIAAKCIYKPFEPSTLALSSSSSVLRSTDSEGAAAIFRGTKNKGK